MPTEPSSCNIVVFSAFVDAVLNSFISIDLVICNKIPNTDTNMTEPDECLWFPKVLHEAFSAKDTIEPVKF